MVDVYETVNTWRDVQMRLIRDKFQVVLLDREPRKLCTCRHQDNVFVFDFFTKYDKDSDEFILCLCCKCRVCNGYICVDLPNYTFPVQIKEPPVIAGLSVKVVKKDSKKGIYA